MCLFENSKILDMTVPDARACLKNTRGIWGKNHWFNEE